MQWLLFGIKQSFEKKNGHNELALTWKIDPEEFILENVCSIKTYDCCNDNCEQCCNFRNTEDILNALEGVSEVKYARWVRREKHCQNDEVVDSGDDVSYVKRNSNEVIENACLQYKTSVF